MAIAIWDAKVVKERELVSAEQQEKTLPIYILSCMG